MAQYLLGVDSGCTVSKAGLFTLAGREVAVASGKSPLLSPHPGWQERDTDAFWETTANAIREVIASSGVDPKEIIAVACAGHGNGLYLVDKKGLPVRNAILSTDSRARHYSDRWVADGVDQKVRPKTMQNVWPAQPNTLLAWLQDHEPETMARAGWVLMAKDYVRFKLTGKFQAELTDFSGTSLMNLQTRDWDDALLADFNISFARDLLAPIVKTADLCGEVTTAAAAETGLAAGTPVAGGMFDIDACGLSCGMIDESQLCIVVGTWGNNQYISKTPITTDDVFMTSCYSMDDYYLMLEGSATSASNLEWFVSQFFEKEAAAAQEQGRNVYDLCNELVESVDPKDANIVFLPFLYASNVNPDAKGCFLGLEGRHTRAHVLRAIYEGVVFTHLSHVKKLLKFRCLPDVIRLTGGAARSNVWLKVFSDVFQVPIQTPQGTELGALGAAIAAAVATGHYASYEQAVQAMVRFSPLIEPDGDCRDVYTRKYHRFQKLIETLDPVWTEMC